MNTTVKAGEKENFSKLAHEWWDTKGPMGLLHSMNFVRLPFIKKYFQGTYKTALDIGCGGGIVSEPLHRMGLDVTGIDMNTDLINIAKAHATDLDIDINYHVQTVEKLSKTGQKFDVITALEIIEHVQNPAYFLKNALDLLSDNGVLILSTINRTALSYAKAIAGAEYIMRYVPIGTHQWSAFLKPSEIASFIRPLGYDIIDIKGMTLSPFTKQWSLCESLDTNYILAIQQA